MYKKVLLFSFFQLLAYLCAAHIDTTIGLTAPKNISQDYNALAAHLCFDQQDDQTKVNAVYNWVTHNIRYDVAFLKKFPKHHDKIIERTLKNRKAVCEGYSMVFTEICRAAGLKAMNIEGYAKDWIFDNGDELYIPRHIWSAVMVNGKWQLFDPTWGAGYVSQSPSKLRKFRNKYSKNKVMYGKKLKFKFRYDTTYFMQDPEAFRLKHLPSDPLWQLTDTVMPIAVFEAGDSAIALFNEQYSHLKQDDLQLARISTFDERQKLFEFADRAYAYNNRYPAVLAAKHAARASAVIEKAFTDTTVQSAELLIRDASLTLRTSQDYIKAQKKTFPEEYGKLKKKNKIKNQVAKKYIREIKTDDKRLIAESKKYTKAAANRYNRIKKKSADAQKRKHDNNADKINDVAAAHVQKKSDAPELLTIKDSISTRTTRLSATQQQVMSQQLRIVLLRQTNEQRLDSLGKSIVFEDSMLVREANARLAMHDSYDDEVTLFSNQFKATKYRKTDSLQKYYLAGFDTICNAYEQLQKMQVAQLDIYKKNNGNLEQYKKWNSADGAVPEQYAASASEYDAAIAEYNKDLATYAGYLKGNKKLFAGLAQLSAHQLKIVEYMERAETRRKAVEEKTIAKKQAFDVKENANQLKNLKEIQKKVDNIAEQLN